MWVVEVNREGWSGPIIIGPVEGRREAVEHQKAWRKALVGGLHWRTESTVEVRQVRMLLTGQGRFASDPDYLFSTYLQHRS